MKPDQAGRGVRDGGGRESAGEESLPDMFWAVARQLREASQETLAPWDITPGHLRALRVLSRTARCGCPGSPISCASRRARPPR